VRRVDGAVKADIAVIGAGTCGCAVARRLAELRPDDTIVLVEATRVGSSLFIDHCAVQSQTQWP
jgi:cation diffusion facilitator CzcD-associated flavoprotein CzcO